MDEKFEIETSFYWDCITCKDYHGFTNSYKSNGTNLKHFDIRIDKVDLEETRRKILNEMKSSRMEKKSVSDWSS